MKSAIVFGANGYLGRHMTSFLMEKNVRVVPVDCHVNSVDALSGYRSVNVVRADEVMALDFAVDVIFCFAGLTGTESGFYHYKDFVEVNELGLLHVLNHHRATGSSARVVFPSTRLIYRGRKGTPLNEKSEQEALTVYAQNKRACEEYLRMYQHLFGTPYTIFRICVPYGNMFPSGYSYGTVGFFLNKAQRGEDIILFGDGCQRRTFTHVQDICYKIWNVLQVPGTENETYNVGGEDLSLLESATLVARKFGVKVICVPWPEMALKLESGDTVFDSLKMDAVAPSVSVYSFSGWMDEMSDTASSF